MEPRVGITTSHDRQRLIGGIVSRTGMSPVALPCISIVARPDELLDEARDICAASDLIFLTSGRIVGFLWPVGGMPKVPVAAVGRITADHVVGAGGDVAFLGEDGSIALARSVVSADKRMTIAFPRAAAVNREASGILSQAASTVVEPVVYETRPVAPPPDPVDAVMFGSPSAVKGWALSRSLDDLTVGAIGKSTAAQLEELGVKPDVVPASPGYAELARLLASELAIQGANR